MSDSNDLGATPAPTQNLSSVSPRSTRLENNSINHDSPTSIPFTSIPFDRPKTGNPAAFDPSLETAYSRSILLSLSAQSGLGPAKIKQISERFEELQALPNLSVEQLISKGCSEFLANKIADTNWAKGSELLEPMQRWQQAGPCRSLLFLNESEYPPLLREIPDPPIFLFAEGDLNQLNNRAIAMVGSRYCSEYGRRIASKIANSMSRKQVTVVSGLALGIDAAAHEGSFIEDLKESNYSHTLSGSVCNTIAVLGTGIDQCYPAKNRGLLNRILAAGGLVLSEFDLGTRPDRKNFPRRNRVVSGLSSGVLVVEAALKSGSLVTAKLALDQNREVFAIPGAPQNPGSEGCNWLIKQGACLVTQTSDINDELNWNFGSAAEVLTQVAAQAPNHGSSYGSSHGTNYGAGQIHGAGNQPQHNGSINSGTYKTNSPSSNNLLEYIEYTPLTIDEIAIKSHLNSQQIMSELMQLELEGEVELTPLGYQRTNCPIR